MEKISFYLEKYQEIGLKEQKIKNLLVQSIQEICHFEINSENIKFSNKIIKIDVIGSKKTEIFIQREKIKTLFYQKIEENSYKMSNRKIL